jgi:hypothetical protein
MTDSLTATYWLSAANFLVLLVPVMTFRRSIVSAYNIYVLTTLIAFGVRPFLGATLGGYTNYPTRLGWWAYNTGLAYQLIFHTLLVLAYCVHRRAERIERKPTAHGSLGEYLLLLGIGFGALVVLQRYSGNAWVPSARTTSIDTAAPGAKYIFPIAIVALASSIPAGLLLLLGRKRHPMVFAFGSLIAMFGLSLLFVRGFVVYAVLSTGLIWNRYRRIKLWHVGALLATAFLIGTFMRPFAAAVTKRFANNAEPQLEAQAATAVEVLGPWDVIRYGLVYTTNNDVADSWPVVIEEADAHGLRWGATFLAAPARFAPTRFRVSSGLLTGSDLVNIRQYGENYAEKSFGLNVSLANELYLNFGIFGMIFGVLPGLLIASVDNWLRSGATDTPARTTMLLATISIGFTGELAASLQWWVLFTLLALGVSLYRRLLRPRTPVIAELPVLSPHGG